jgi:hypothetical protein
VETGHFVAVYRQCCIPKEQNTRFGMSHMSRNYSPWQNKSQTQNITIAEK